MNPPNKPRKRLHSKKRRIRKLYREQNGKCYYCKCHMLPPGSYDSHRDTKAPDNLCTIEHLEDKFSPNRPASGEKQPLVAACLRCNNERGRESLMSQPRENLWKIGAAIPSLMERFEFLPIAVQAENPALRERCELCRDMKELRSRMKCTTGVPKDFHNILNEIGNQCNLDLRHLEAENGISYNLRRCRLTTPIESAISGHRNQSPYQEISHGQEERGVAAG